MLRSIGKRSGSQAEPAGDMSEIRACGCCSDGSANLVAHDACGREKNVLSHLRLVACGIGGRTALIVHPALKFLWRLCDKKERHLRMLMAAEFRALAPIRACLVHLH